MCNQVIIWIIAELSSCVTQTSVKFEAKYKHMDNHMQISNIL